MQIHLLSLECSLINQFVSELRNIGTQDNRMRFRKNIERIGQIMAYEVSKQMPWAEETLQTPLGSHQSKVLAEQPVLATILRAGLSMHQGFLDFFDKADCAFVSAYRRHHPDHSFDIVVEYMACPDLENRILLLIDPMLASGQSIHLTYQALLKNGNPKAVHIISLIASLDGVNYLKEQMPHATLWLADMDEKLDSNGYIVPGLGDAGDLCFGEKNELK